jgi:hypothetical protein
MLLRRQTIRATLLALSLCFGSSCTTAQQPKWDGELWSHDGLGFLVRKQEGKSVSCTDPESKKFMAMRWTDFETFFQTYVTACERWKR